MYFYLLYTANQAQIESKYFQHEIPAPIVVEPTSNTNRSKPTNLFSESDDDDQQQTIPDKPRPKLPTNNNETLAANPAASIFRNQPAKPTPSMGWINDEPPDIYAPVPSTRKPLNLFEDTDDDDDMFSAPSQQPSKQHIQIQPTSQPIIPNINKDPIPNTVNPQSLTSNTPASTKSKILNLFDDSPPDDMFDDIITKPHSVPKNRVSIFDDDKDDTFKEELNSSIAKRAKHIDASGSSISGITSISVDAPKMVPTKDELKNPTNIESSQQNPKKVHNIFDSDEEDFLTKTPPNIPKKYEIKDLDNTKATLAPTPKTFANDPKPKVHNDDFLVETTKQIPKKKTIKHPVDFVANPAPAAAPRNPANNKNTKVHNIFDSDDDDFPGQMPTKKSETTTKKILSTNVAREMPKKSNIFDDLFGDDQPPDDNFADIFGTKRATTNDMNPTLVDKPIVSDVIGSNSDIDKDPKRYLVHENTNPTKKPLSSVFDNDVGLVDEPKSMFEPSKVSISSRTQSKGLFGETSDDDESDWFSSISNTKSKDLGDQDLFGSSSTEKINTSTLQSATEDNKSIEKAPIVENTIQQTHLNHEHVTSPSSVQFANFFEKNEDSSDAKLVENRRVFVSYLDNEDQPQTVVNDNSESKQTAADTQVANSNQFEPQPVIEDVAEHINVKEPSVDEIHGTHLEPSETSDAINTIGTDKMQVLEDDKHFQHAHVPQFEDTVSEQTITSEVIPSAEDKISSPQITSRSTTFFDDLPPDDNLPLDDDFSSSLFAPKTSPIAQSIGLFDDLPPDDDFLPTASSKLTSASLTGVFDDIPPDDDEFHTTSAIIKPTGLSASTLFDDLPPDDDLFDKTMSTKQADKAAPVRTTEKALFYEDFADTIVTKPDSVDSTQNENSANFHDEVDKAHNFFEKMSKFSQPTHDLAKSVPERPKPRKLNENFKINVSALLPGAKRPSINKPAEDFVSKTPEQEEEIISCSQALSTKTESEDSSRLIGLNKGRAKILVKRRPSTRQGRQSEYRKSLMVQEVSEFENELEEPAPPLQKTIPPVSTKSSISIADMLANIPAKSSAVVSEPQLHSERDWLIAPDASTTFRKMTPKPKPSDPPKTAPLAKKSVPLRSSTSLFSEDDDDDLFASAKPKAKPTTIAGIKSLTDVPLPTNNFVNRASKPQMKSNLFDDNDSGDDLFGDTIKKAIDIKPKPITKVLPSKSSLFGDSDDGDDDLFGSSSKQTVRSTGSFVIKIVYYISSLTHLRYSQTS